MSVEKVATRFTSGFAKMLKQNGTRWLTYRDVPCLIKKYVNGNTALDYGCGTATSTLFLKSMGLNVEGVDISQDMVMCAKASDPTGKYTIIKSGEIPVSDNSYDFVFLHLVLHYISSKAEQVKILREIGRCLKPGGALISTDPSESFYKSDWLTVKTVFEENKIRRGGDLIRTEFMNEDTTVVYMHYWSDNDYREVITKAGLKIVHTHSPLGKDTDNYNWINENRISPFMTYVSKKIMI